MNLDINLEDGDDDREGLPKIDDDDITGTKASTITRASGEPAEDRPLLS